MTRFPSLVAATLIVSATATPAAATVRYVDVNSPNPTPPFTSWATAATVIQDAVDAADPGDEVLVTNGVYATGGWAVHGTMTNRVAVTKPLTLLSVNGSEVTVIQGYQVPGTTNGDGAVRCAYVTNGAVLAGFTLTQGATQTGVAHVQYSGGGVFCQSTNAVVTNCVLTGNAAHFGGGAYDGTLAQCILTGNSADYQGGGAYWSTLINCNLSSNSASSDGGGAYSGTLDHCILAGNSARSGGGAYAGELSDCLLIGNLASNGGGANGSALSVCLLSNNVVSAEGGGAYASQLTNCTLTANTAVSGGGVASGAASSCSFNGNTARSGGGAYASTLSDCRLSTNTAQVGGAIYGGSHVNCELTGNSAYRHGGGAYAATLTGCTLASNSAGHDGGGAFVSVLNECTLTANSAFYDGGGTWRGYLSSSLLISNLAGANGGGANEGTLQNCLVWGNAAQVYGGGAYNAVLDHCVITNNSAISDGGGACGGTLSYCRLTANLGQHGGGAAWGFARNCTFTGNVASGNGGGAAAMTLNNCSLTRNRANGLFGGGAYASTLNNCIVYYNVGPDDVEDYLSSAFWFCSVPPLPWSPLPPNGAGNITSEPGFVDLAGGDLRLQPNSPCINAGNNAYVSDTTDLDGNPRIVGGTVDIGAYEFQTPTSLLSYAWAQQYGLPTDGSADFTDNDGDLLNNWQEWRAGTIPTNALSVLRLLTPISNGTNLTVTWESVAGRNYFLERSPDLSGARTFTRIASNVVGQVNTTSYLDTNAVGAGPRFYRVGVE